METHWFFWWVESQARCLHRVERADSSDGKDEYECDHRAVAKFNGMNMIYNIFHQKLYSLLKNFPIHHWDYAILTCYAW